MLENHAQLPLISVIVPVYNVEDYLNDCVLSICGQTYTKLEILLIDDGSTDASLMLCERLAAQDPRIKVVHQENAGLSAARNTGIAHTTGDMFVFVDSDDACAPTMIKELYALHQKYDADIAVCNYREIETRDEFDEALHEGFEREEAPQEIIWTRDNIFDFISESKAIDIYPSLQVNKLFVRSIFDGLRYEVGKLHEDEFIIHYELDSASLVALTTKELYLYRRHASSITRNQTLTNKVHALQAFKDRALFYENKQLERYAIEMFRVIGNFGRDVLYERDSYEGSPDEEHYIADIIAWSDNKLQQSNTR